MRVMLIEDDPNMRGLLETLLEIEGFSVIIYPDAMNQKSILDYLEKELPDTILMDVHLQGVNGINLLKDLRLRNQFSRTKVIMTSGMDVKRECMAAGADGFLLKPYVPDELITMLKN